MKYQKNRNIKSLRTQKILGGLLIALGAIPIILEGNATALFITAPVGLGLIFTKKIFISND